jgi:hypothetical protein
MLDGGLQGRCRSAHTYPQGLDMGQTAKAVIFDGSLRIGQNAADGSSVLLPSGRR